MPCGKSPSILIPTPTPRCSEAVSFPELVIFKSFVTSRASIRQVLCNLGGKHHDDGSGFQLSLD
jgi:hypothetical protein